MPKQGCDLFRKLPNVGQLLERPDFLTLQRTYSRPLVIEFVRLAMGDLRRDVAAGQHTEASLEGELRELGTRIEQSLQDTLRTSLRPVLNATGVILQTNLGRAPLSNAAIQHISDVARGYCNLELDLETGERGHRDMHVERLILNVLAMRDHLSMDALQGKAAVVVNNCAAACFLALNTLAEGGEVIVSRGELIEIGGGFRVPDILRKSGAVLCEVGTTNRTRLSDYEAAITPATRLILRVHQSNFRIEGFTERPTLEELRDLGLRASLPVFEDQGTGCAVSLKGAGIENESSWVQSVASDIALIACSGDKLLGGPQCGILVGSKPHIENIRSNPLLRTMRVDKLTYAALETTLLEYLRGTEENLPAIAMMHTSPETIKDRCLLLAGALRSSNVTVAVVETRGLLGGGTTPGASLPSFAVTLEHTSVSESVLAARLRCLDPPVMTRTQEGRIVLDLRTIPPEDDVKLTQLLKAAVEQL